MKVPADRRDALRAAVEQAGGVAREATGSGELWRYELDGATVTLWRTGTCRVAGKGEGREVLERLVAEVAAAPATEPPPPRASGHAPTGALGELPRDRAWAGVDESGKGDYFGPLVSAAVCVEPDAALALEEAGVRDSKRLTDKRVHALAPVVRDAVVARLTVIAPPRYNELYAELRREGRRLNDLLAWAHARSIEELLETTDPAYAIVDQFADARVVEGRLRTRTRERRLRVVQFPRAEADVAVAAASILAREGFLTWMDRASERVGVTLPKGASPAVEAAGREIVALGGEELLGSVAKLHFVTTARVLRPAPSG